MAANQNAHTEVPPKGHFPPFQTETFASQLFWFAIAFVLLYAIIARLAVPRIAGIMAARSGRVADDLAEAKRLKGASEKAIAEYEKALADARGRAQALANETREKFAAEAGAARKELDASLNRRLAEAEQTIATRRAAAMANVHDIAVETASAIVERLTGQAPAKADVTSAVAETLKR